MSLIRSSIYISTMILTNDGIACLLLSCSEIDGRVTGHVLAPIAARPSATKTARLGPGRAAMHTLFELPEHYIL
jgi:hypothetical protein